jgi:hypothetical protein
VHAQVQQRSAARGGAVDDPLDPLLLIAIDHAANELEHRILDRLVEGADGLDQRGVADDVRHCREHTSRRGACGDVGGLGGVDRAGFFHRERDALCDQETRQRRHVAMPRQGKGEIRLQRGAHFLIIREGLASGPGRHRFGPCHVRVANPDDADVGQFQAGIEEERRMPM